MLGYFSLFFFVFSVVVAILYFCNYSDIIRNIFIHLTNKYNLPSSLHFNCYFKIMYKNILLLKRNTFTTYVVASPSCPTSLSHSYDLEIFCRQSGAKDPVNISHKRHYVCSQNRGRKLFDILLYIVKKLH